MLKPHDSDLLDAVAEVLRTGLSDLRRDMDARLTELSTRIEAIPAPLKGDPGSPGEPGKSVMLEDVIPWIDQALEKAVAALPPAEPGKDAEPLDPEVIIAGVLAKMPVPEPGKDGESVSLGDVQPMIEQTVKEAVAAIPVLKGDPGEPGKDAPPVDIPTLVMEVVACMPKPVNGKDAPPVNIPDLVERVLAKVPVPENGKSITPQDVAPMITAEVAKAVEAIPKPKDGEPGKSITVEDIRGLFETEQAKWALEFERRAADLLQRAIDRMPKPKDGSDGLGFDDLEVLHDGERTFEFRFTKGEQVKSFPFKVPAMIYREVYRGGTEYERGDVVTWGGSSWVALESPTGKPGEGSGWKLMTKRGRDGDPGKPGEPGKPGRDLTRPNGVRP